MHKSRDLDDDEKLEELMGHIGEFGRYQLCQFLLQVLAGFVAGIHMLSSLPVSHVPDHRCAIPNLETDGKVLDWNSTEVLKWIPKKSDGDLEPCLLIDQNTKEEYKCSEWVYKTDVVTSSRGMEWDYVCRNKWMLSVYQSSYFVGVFIGAVTLGRLADKFGRKTIFVISAFLQLIFGIAVAFIPEYYTLLLFTVGYGIFGSAGCYITGFVLTMELVGASWRTVCGVSFQVMFALGIAVLGCWGFVIKDRMWLQVCYGLHSLLLIGHFWLLDESPRWLWSQGRKAEAVKIIEKAAKINKLEPIDRAHFLPSHRASRSSIGSQRSRSIHGSRTSVNKVENEASPGLLDLFRTPRLRRRTLNVCLNWFSNSLAYYGLTLSSGSLTSNLYISMILMGFTEIPVYILTVLLLDRTGRRFLTAVPLLLGGGSCIAACFTPKGEVITTVVLYFGRFCIACSFAVIYNYSTELFPTVIRNSAMGLGSMCARSSGVLTPFISLLDTFDLRLPRMIIGVIAILSGFLTMFLPETLKQTMPQTLQDGEDFGKGDTCFTTGCFGRRRRATTVPVDEPTENNRE